MNKPGPVVLQGRHVRLEPLAAEHLAEIEHVGAEAEIWRYTMCLRPEARESARLWHERVLAAATRGEWVAFAIVAGDRVVGGTTFLDISVPDCRLEIGNTWHAPAVWRTAVNTESKLLLLRHAFETLGANRVQLKTDGRNVRSQTAIARLGAQREGVLRSHLVMPDGFVRDSVMFSIVRAEWPGVRARLEERLARG